METMSATISWRGDYAACIPDGSVTVDLATDHLDDEFREHTRNTLRDLYSALTGERVSVTFSDEGADEVGIVRCTR